MLIFEVFFSAGIIGKMIFFIFFFFSVYTFALVWKLLRMFWDEWAIYEELYANINEGQIKIVEKIYDSLLLKIYSSILDNHVNLKSFGNEKKDKKIREDIFCFTEKFELELEEELTYLSLIGSISPFIGLFGTIIGIIDSFRAIVSANSNSITVVAPALSEALLITAIGIFIAIPSNIFANIFYSYKDDLNRKIELLRILIMHKLEELSFKK